MGNHDMERAENVWNGKSFPASWWWYMHFFIALVNAMKNNVFNWVHVFPRRRQYRDARWTYGNWPFMKNIHQGVKQWHLIQSPSSCSWVRPPPDCLPGRVWFRPAKVNYKIIESKNWLQSTFSVFRRMGNDIVRRPWDIGQRLTRDLSPKQIFI